jgi:hypothetical protein
VVVEERQPADRLAELSAVHGRAHGGQSRQYVANCPTIGVRPAHDSLPGYMADADPGSHLWN